VGSQENYVVNCIALVQGMIRWQVLAEIIITKHSVSIKDRKFFNQINDF
jgi:hypothetical protein